MSYSPIVVFAYNRLESLKKTIDSLLNNSESRDCDLFVFVDGPKDSSFEDQEKVESVRDYVRSIVGFKTLSIKLENRNKGLGPSIIDGVTEVISRYGRAVVVEDDLIVTQNFISIINQGLDKYDSVKEVFSICGYSNTVDVPSHYVPDFYYCTRSSSWGWATWSDRWNTVDWQLNSFDLCKVQRRAFNKWGGSDCYKMLKDWHDGKNKSWAIRFCYSQFVQNKLSLFPIKSLVLNNGFDDSGTNCKKWNRFNCTLDDSGGKTMVWPEIVELVPELLKSALAYHSIRKRAISKIMYIIYR